MAQIDPKTILYKVNAKKANCLKLLTFGIDYIKAENVVNLNMRGRTRRKTKEAPYSGEEYEKQ